MNFLNFRERENLMIVTEEERKKRSPMLVLGPTNLSRNYANLITQKMVNELMNFCDNSIRILKMFDRYDRCGKYIDSLNRTRKIKNY
jgi:hypothetical protein